MDWYEVNWIGPYPIETADKRPEADTLGLYAIYQKSTKPKLLYIGKTYSQPLGKRLQQHRREWLHRVNGKLAIHFGAIALCEGRRISSRIVGDIEELLIHYYYPPFNVASKKGYLGREMLVFNTGKIGAFNRMICTDGDLLKLLRKGSLSSTLPSKTGWPQGQGKKPLLPIIAGIRQREEQIL